MVQRRRTPKSRVQKYPLINGHRGDITFRERNTRMYHVNRHVVRALRTARSHFHGMEFTGLRMLLRRRMCNLGFHILVSRARPHGMSAREFATEMRNIRARIWELVVEELQRCDPQLMTCIKDGMFADQVHLSITKGPSLYFQGWRTFGEHV